MHGDGHRKIPPRVVIWGGTGQAKVMRFVIEHGGARVVAVFDDTPGLPSPFADIEIHQGWDGFRKWLKNEDAGDLGFCLAIGNPHGRVRLRLHEQLVREGLRPTTLVHPTAWVSPSAIVGDGAQIHAGAIVETEARLGLQCIVNTGARVDHECVLQDGIEIGPGATLCGCVHAGVNATIYAGATVLPRIRIGPDAIVGAGAVVTKDVPGAVTVIGVPARLMSSRKGE